jgi:hypothetical protein
MLHASRPWVPFLISLEFFNSPNPSSYSHTIALGWTQLLTEMSTRILPGVKWGQHIRLTRKRNVKEPVSEDSCIQEAGRRNVGKAVWSQAGSMWYVPPKHWFTHGLHGTISHKMAALITTNLRTSNPTWIDAASTLCWHFIPIL